MQRWCGAFAAALTAVLVLLVAACGSSPTSPSGSTGSAPYSQTDLRLGTGTEATSGRRVTVNYTGWLYSATAAENKGTQFDSSLSAGRTPFLFVLGAGQVIRGWDQGVAGMRVGGTRRLVIPASLGYGSAGAGGGVIPPNATLVFDVDLLDVQ